MNPGDILQQARAFFDANIMPLAGQLSATGFMSNFSATDPLLMGILIIAGFFIARTFMGHMLTMMGQWIFIGALASIAYLALKHYGPY